MPNIDEIFSQQFFFSLLVLVAGTSCIKSQKAKKIDAIEPILKVTPKPPEVQSADSSASVDETPTVSTKRIKGVWISNQFENYASESNIENVLTDVKKMGFNTVSPVIWRNACPLWDSSVYRNWVPQYKCPASEMKDTFQVILNKAQELGLRVIPWFDLGLNIDTSSSIYSYAKSHFWIIPGLEKKGRYFLNSSLVPVTNLILSLNSELVNKYKVKELLWDDHLGIPGDDSDGAKKASLIQFNQTLSKELKKHGVFFWLAHHKLSWAQKVYNAHWNEWSFDRFVIEAYVGNNFQKDAAEAKAIGGGIGIAAGLGSQNTWEQAIDQVKEVMAEPDQDFFIFSYGHIKKHNTHELQALLKASD